LKNDHTPSVAVTLVDGEPRAATDLIASGMEQQHTAVIKLVRRHMADLAQFGRVGFEIRPFATPGGMQRREVALLNEPQAALLISMMRNSARVVGFKVALVREFFRMRDELQRREVGCWQRMLMLEQRDAGSKARASIGSKLMLERKRDLPAISAERALLEHEIQPGLLPN
jgi:phage regulator Rha-like protein